MEKEKGLKLFGVRIDTPPTIEGVGEEVMRKCFSMGNLSSCAGSNQGLGLGDHGYLSDGDLVKNSRKRCRQERKKGVPWTEEEHRTFLAGLEKLGKGDWRGISKNFVITRTPTQVASHAQKYFLRQTNPNKKKRRSSLFDVGINSTVTPTATEPPSELPSKKVDEVSGRTDHQSKENNLACAQSVIGVSTVAQVTEASEPWMLATSNSCSPNLHGVTHAGWSSTRHSESTNLSVDSDFLQISQHHVPMYHQPIKSSSLENNDLELSIAPPMAKLSSQTATGAIWVI